MTSEREWLCRPTGSISERLPRPTVRRTSGAFVTTAGGTPSPCRAGSFGPVMAAPGSRRGSHCSGPTCATVRCGSSREPPAPNSRCSGLGSATPPNASCVRVCRSQVRGSAGARSASRSRCCAPNMPTREPTSRVCHRSVALSTSRSISCAIRACSVTPMTGPGGCSTRWRANQGSRSPACELVKPLVN